MAYSKDADDPLSPLRQQSGEGREGEGEAD